MTIDRALEIIASHGADARRWPADERAAVLALAGDPQVASALASARSLDLLLGDWAVAPATPAIDLAAIKRMPQQRASAGRGGWIVGVGMAAAIAGVIALAPTRDTTSTRIADASTVSNTTVTSATVPGAGNGSDAEAFAYVFTPTADEDDLI